MLEKLADLDAQHAVAVAGGGEKYVERHHARGKLTARVVALDVLLPTSGHRDGVLGVEVGELLEHRYSIR